MMTADWRRKAVGGAATAAALVVATLALAQPRKPPPHTAPSAKSASDSPAGDTAPRPPPSASAAPSAQGPVPAPASDQSADGGKLSPLNPEANEFSDAGPPVETNDYDRLLTDIAALRARVAAVSDTLFHSRIAIDLDAKGDHARIASLSVSVDDGVVWVSPSSTRPDDETTVYDHSVAPGHHAVTVDVERRDDRNDVFRSSQRSRFIVDVPNDQRLSVHLTVSDDSNMGGDFPSDHQGRYDLRIRMKAKAEAIGR